ncbi:hypothetical protein PRECH8_06930 [Insulibacter thermoxylanivorax]|uniref:histidine kinase n=1 Tax=Insulibacter thermoxylanivorax TaxID=2749268 RepID=A0A916QAX9_9BACL|nr:HAMP domain-containing sensor histidine kinase [Insulibacter thermoxylanivorax]GFR37397.1 hypothetical protein PRECH8_06930 [Insulibacter thermoxylanivorax]
MSRLFRSLQAKYMLIIFVGLVLIQFTYITLSLVLTIGINFRREAADGMPSAQQIEKDWHEAAGSLTEVTRESVLELFREWKTRYPEASMFWVDEQGDLAVELDASESLPTSWSASYTAAFIKERYGGDPFTVIAFAGDEGGSGFVVFEIDRRFFLSDYALLYEEYAEWIFAALILIILLFILISYMFFRGIRKRLVQLQEAMSIRDVDGLPVPIDVRKQDEIGQLEQSFNEMIEELKESKRREQEEEQLRRELIANLSHDLRTPLTKIRAQAFTINKENLSAEGRRAIEAMESSVVSMDRLIDNLMAYTLLMANKYQYAPRSTDVLRFVREHLATWYPLFEREGFEVDVDLAPLRVSHWEIDPIWMGRVLDNLFQNVLRHAKQGRFVRVSTETTSAYDALVIADRGPGMGSGSSEEKGAGIGLSIVDRMLLGMNLHWDVHSDVSGTVVQIKRIYDLDDLPPASRSH